MNKLKTCTYHFLVDFHKLSLNSIPITVPRSIAAVSITAEVTVESAVVHIHIEDVSPHSLMS